MAQKYNAGNYVLFGRTPTCHRNWPKAVCVIERLVYSGVYTLREVELLEGDWSMINIIGAEKPHPYVFDSYDEYFCQYDYCPPEEDLEIAIPDPYSILF